MRHLALLSLLLLLGPLPAVFGQSPPPGPGQQDAEKKAATLDQKDGPQQPGAKGDDSKEPKEPKEPKENPRMQKLKSLSFDRRPSSILKAWSNVPEPAKKDNDKKPNPIDVELAVFQRQVTLGQWQAVQEYLAKLPKEEAQAAYKQMLQSLAAGQMMRGGPGGGEGMDMDMDMMQMQGMNPAIMQFMEKNKFSAEDVIGLAKAAPPPQGLEKDQISQLGNIVRQTVAGGTVVEHLVKQLKVEAAKPKAEGALTERQAASLLMAAGQGTEVGVFLPTLDKALADNDHEALNLIARHYLALHVKEKKLIRLEQAWSAIQAILASPKVERAEKEEALKRAVELAPKIREELGQTWLEQSFTKEPQRGMDILSTLGATAAQGIQTQPQNKDGRLQTLNLQKTAVEALLKAAPDRAADWRGTLTLLAGNWLKEAEFSHQFDRSTSFGPRMRRDPYGNLFYTGDDMDEDMMPMMGQQQQMPQALSVAKVMEARPSDKWIERIDDGMKPKMAMVFAQLYLKVGEEAKAFPFIEQLAKTHPDKGRELVKEFLKVWTRNHNPNANKEYTNPYMWMYGFERRSESIPLTRAKQERNLVELTEWTAKLRGLNLGEFNEELLAKAFTTCHSNAEVYRMSAIETVFGKIDQLKPRTLAGLAQQMRENLAGLWRQPAEQKDKKTNRKLKDIQAEVLRGYDVAKSVVDNGIQKFPDHWALTMAKASLLHDENNFRQELNKSSGFSKLRQEALILFGKAAEQYAAQVKTISDEEITTQVYEQWLYASLGACDLGQVTELMVADMKQPDMIRKALQSLPGEMAERHMNKFANLLFTRLSAVKPAVKFRYLKCGFEIVGDHPLAHEARKVYDYYKDLVTEIKLEALIDGNDMVGYKQPFGVFVNLKHTRDIERESGGFGKYLMNQNSGGRYYYNYGRPTVDYRDRFTTMVDEALKEQFEVLSVTFQTEKVNSRALLEDGWRYTPYAYLLLKARGPQVDKIPSMRIDLDFLDTSGYVIIPIESPVLPLDASGPKGTGRPHARLQITQTLDERQADKGKLLVEIKAVALGLVPELDQIVNVAPAGFEVEKINDQGVSVARFDPDSEQNAVTSERTWTIALKANPGQIPTSFTFAGAKAKDTEMTYQRFKDADLVKTDAEISLEEQYGKGSLAWLWWTLGGAAVLLAGVVASIVLLRKRAPERKARMTLPEHLSPFTVLALLKRVQDNKSLTESQHKELEQSIGKLERHYFSEDGNGQVDLRSLAEMWVQRAHLP